VWGHWQETAESCTPAVHPVLLIHAPDELPVVDHVTMVPSLPAYDPLLHHMALVLQFALATEGEEGQLYAESLTNALVIHFLRRYAAARPALRVGSGGLSPYKLRRTIAYIQPIWPRSYPWSRSPPWHR
jgi:AraC family transcriptional regulator